MDDLLIMMRKEHIKMKIFRMIGRSFRDAFKSVFRNISLSFASISCITITLIIVALSIIASLNVNNFAKVIKHDVTMVVFIDNAATSADLAKIETSIKELDNIDSIELKSKEEVKNEMAASSDKLGSIMKDWEPKDNPLKDTFLVKVKKLENIKKTAEDITKIDKVVVVDYGEGMVEKLITTFNAVEKVAIVAVIALVVVTVFLIVNTIKLTIFSRKREISIMRLVGASNFSIKTPFVVEGMVLGIIGSIIPILLTTYGYLAFYKHFQGQLFSPLIRLILPEPFIYYIAGAILIVGMLVGMIGSYRAVQKYLKV